MPVAYYELAFEQHILAQLRQVLVFQYSHGCVCRGGRSGGGRAGRGSGRAVSVCRGGKSEGFPQAEARRAHRSRRPHRDREEEGGQGQGRGQSCQERGPQREEEAHSPGEEGCRPELRRSRADREVEEGRPLGSDVERRSS